MGGSYAGKGGHCYNMEDTTYGYYDTEPAEANLDHQRGSGGGTELSRAGGRVRIEAQSLGMFGGHIMACGHPTKESMESASTRDQGKTYQGGSGGYVSIRFRDAPSDENDVYIVGRVIVTGGIGWN